MSKVINIKKNNTQELLKKDIIDTLDNLEDDDQIIFIKTKPNMKEFEFTHLNATGFEMFSILSYLSHYVANLFSSNLDDGE